MLPKKGLPPPGVIAILHAIWRELRCISEGLRERSVTSSDEIEETLDVVCFRELHLTHYQQRLERFLRGLLRVKRNGLGEDGALTQELLAHEQVGRRLRQPVAGKSPNHLVRRLHRSLCRTCWPDRRSRR